MDLADEDKLNKVAAEQALDIQHIKERLDMFDQRLDNIDSMVTAVAERIMRRPITLNVTCSHCGKEIEIAVLGTEKPTR